MNTRHFWCCCYIINHPDLFGGLGSGPLPVPKVQTKPGEIVFSFCSPHLVGDETLRKLEVCFNTLCLNHVLKLHFKLNCYSTVWFVFVCFNIFLSSLWFGFTLFLSYSYLCVFLYPICFIYLHHFYAFSSGRWALSRHTK